MTFFDALLAVLVGAIGPLPVMVVLFGVVVTLFYLSVTAYRYYYPWTRPLLIFGLIVAVWVLVALFILTEVSELPPFSWTPA